MMDTAPMKGLKVLELASVLAGPAVGMFFAELGATVYKIENVTSQGDVTRKWKLPAEEADSDVSGYFSSVNWGKQSLAINLCHEQGLEIIYNMLAQCDIVLVSYKPGDAEKLKVDYASLRKLNSHIIYAHITGYGMHNPRAGFDAIIQAETGFTYMNGEADGNAVKMPVALMDILAAHQLKEAILIALYQREKMGSGQYIETSLFKSGVSSLANQATNWLVGEIIPQRMGSDHPNIVPYGTIYKTADNKEVVLAVGTDKQFQQLVVLLGCKEIADNPKFTKNHDRVKNKTELNRHLQSIIGQFKRDELLSKLQLKSIPAGGVFNLQEVFELPEAQEMIMQGQYPEGNSIKGVKSIAFKMQNQIEIELTPPPHYGEHTHDILQELLGYTEEFINKLSEKGVIYASKE